MCLLAHFFPGIPADFLTWPENLQTAWIDNIPFVLANRDVMEEAMRRGAHGAYFRTLWLTDDKTAAINARMDVQAAEIMAKGQP